MDIQPHVEGLRCEYSHLPLGVDIVAPRLSWQISVSDGPWQQSGYQIQVSSKPENLLRGEPDVWDSGYVASAQSQWIMYAGPVLRSFQHYYWRVRAWNLFGGTTTYSEPGEWEMGIVNAEIWSGEWIGLRQTFKEPVPDFTSAKWISSDKGEGDIYYLRKQFTLPEVRDITEALMLMTGDELYTVYCNGEEVARGQFVTVPQWLDLMPYLKDDVNTIMVKVFGRIDCQSGFIASARIMGPDWLLTVITDGSWEASPRAEWDRAGLLHCLPEIKEWNSANMVANYGDAPWGLMNINAPPRPCVYLRKEIVLPVAPIRARIYATALGLYHLRVNGQPASDSELTPGWTDYSQRLRYQSYDVTDFLTKGSNVLGAILADGWYAGYVGWAGREQYGGYPLKFNALIFVEYPDGTSEILGTDETWKGNTGPLRFADLLMGTLYDANYEQLGWDTPNFSGRGWHPTTVLREGPAPISLKSDPVPPTRVTQRVKPITVTPRENGCYLFDLGQNFAGKINLLCLAQRGRRITLRYGEVLNADGSLYVDNLRTARQLDLYIPSHSGVVTIAPMHTIHGFRYVEVRGLGERPSIDCLVGLVMHSDAPTVSHMTTNNALVNRLLENIDWGLRSNIVSIPTDCPQRDERLGWTGDIQVFAPTACWLRDMGSFLNGWLDELAGAQLATGAYPDVAPRIPGPSAGHAAWGAAGILVPWVLYEYYGDEQVLARHFNGMQRWVTYLKEDSHEGIRDPEGYGDWLFVESETPKDVISTAYYAHTVDTVGKIAEVLGYHDVAAKYRLLFHEIQNAFITHFVSGDFHIKGHTQSGYVLALAFNLIPNKGREACLAHLIRLIHQRDNHLDTGFLGVSYLLPVLSEGGYHNLACQLIAQDTYPSWGFMIKNGATTLWERWNGYDPHKGFADVRMNSFNHYALGSVGDWLYRYVAGIRPKTPGFREVIIAPYPDKYTFWRVGVSYDTIYGPIYIDWHLANQMFHAEFQIPSGVSAVVSFPQYGRAELTHLYSARKSVLSGSRSNDRVMYQVGAGHYRFVSGLT